MTASTVHEVRAVNLMPAAENKIHDDSVARTFGFTGALVPGVEVYAYMAHAPVARWGRAWLDGGTASCRFLSPVYDGDAARVDAREDGGSLDLTVRCGDRLCATGSVGAPGSAPPAPSVSLLPTRVPPAHEARPAASLDTLAVGTALGIRPWSTSAENARAYLDGVGETQALYLRERLVHPGQILRLANAALVQNVVLGPWIHVGSQLANHSAAHYDDVLTLHARITANDVRKGHAFVVFDALVVAGDTRLIASITHTAIWRLRSAN
jgi:hypothetical protein